MFVRYGPERRTRPHRTIAGVPAASGWVDIRAEDLNSRFKELVGDDYTVKDLRTWHGTVLAAAAFAERTRPSHSGSPSALKPRS